MISEKYSLFIILIFVFGMAMALICKETVDIEKRRIAYNKIKNNKDTVDYLTFIQMQPTWRISLTGALIVGMLYYCFYKSISAVGGDMNKIPIFSSLFVIVLSFLFITLTTNFILFHIICPRICLDIESSD